MSCFYGFTDEQVSNYLTNLSSLLFKKEDISLVYDSIGCLHSLVTEKGNVLLVQQYFTLQTSDVGKSRFHLLEMTEEEWEVFWQFFAFAITTHFSIVIVGFVLGAVFSLFRSALR